MSFAACGETNDMELAPTRCISASLLPRDYSACRFLGSFSQKLPRRFTRQSKSEKGLRVLVRHGNCLLYTSVPSEAPRSLCPQYQRVRLPVQPGDCLLKRAFSMRRPSTPVSYTHLDVYKRQIWDSSIFIWKHLTVM